MIVIRYFTCNSVHIFIFSRRIHYFGANVIHVRSNFKPQNYLRRYTVHFTNVQKLFKNILKNIFIFNNLSILCLKLLVSKMSFERWTQLNKLNHGHKLNFHSVKNKVLLLLMFFSCVYAMTLCYIHNNIVKTVVNT